MLVTFSTGVSITWPKSTLRPSHIAAPSWLPADVPSLPIFSNPPCEPPAAPCGYSSVLIRYLTSFCPMSALAAFNSRSLPTCMLILRFQVLIALSNARSQVLSITPDHPGPAVGNRPFACLGPVTIVCFTKPCLISNATLSSGVPSLPPRTNLGPAAVLVVNKTFSIINSFSFIYTPILLFSAAYNVSLILSTDSFGCDLFCIESNCICPGKSLNPTFCRLFGCLVC